MPPLETANFTGNLIIYEHPAAHYAHSPVLDIYHLRDDRFDDISTYLDFDYFMSIFNTAFEEALEAGRPIITIPYTSVIAKVVQARASAYKIVSPYPVRNYKIMSKTV
jgi:hypothetical protein